MSPIHTAGALRRARLLSQTLALSWALAACGGGADGGAPATAPAPPAAQAPASPVAGTRATCNLADFQAEVLRLVNAARAAGGSCGSSGSFAPSTPLAWNNALAQAALVHSDDMVAGDFFSHTGSDGSSAGTRAAAAGYSAGTWGENIAAGQPTVAAVMQAWMASPGHCANILRASYRDIGLACVAGTGDSRYGTYWTMVLGAPR
ncbi:CAP domain-containing protein [Rubrivivax sp. RP6-9]|uniref:CAP domain-containing protein n=1 Tax=Rubrivivax sp. RP6-9 TaxID=3415750 RepID=UPI003CC6B0C9